MFKILIVDDFFADRENIKEMVNSYTDIDLTVVGECENGAQALDVMDDLEPDIIICDVNMPYMDGFELAKAVRPRFPGMKIIFSSLYHEFEYVKKALDLDSYGYILKPVDSVELRECILKVTNLMYDEDQQLREYEELRKVLDINKPVLAENLVRDLINGVIAGQEDLWDRINYLGINIKKGTYVLLLIEIDDFISITEGLKIEQKQIFSLRIYEKIKGALASNEDIVLTRMNDVHFSAIYCIPESLCIDSIYKDISLISDIVLLQAKNENISLTLAVSSSCTNIFNICNLYEQCLYLLKFKFSLGKGCTIYSNDVPSSVKGPDIDFNSMQKDVRYLLNNGRNEEIVKYIDSLFDNLPVNADNQYLKHLCFCIIICIQIVLSNNKEDYYSVFNPENLVWEKLLEFETILDVKHWIKDTFILINQHLSSSIKHNNKAIIEKVKRYIEDCSIKDLNLKLIAADLFYSPNYLNYIFKDETGETISEYTTRCRIEKAKEMLSDPGNKLYEVAESLGYSHAAYFNSVFKKYMGLTPKEYRDRCCL